MSSGMAKVIHNAALVAPASEADQRGFPTKGACEYLQSRWGIPRTERTFQKMRRDGDGPKYRRYGNDVIYTPSAIDDWVIERFGDEVRSTSEESARRLLAVAKGEG